MIAQTPLLRGAEARPDFWEPFGERRFPFEQRQQQPEHDGHSGRDRRPERHGQPEEAVEASVTAFWVLVDGLIGLQTATQSAYI